MKNVMMLKYHEVLVSQKRPKYHSALVSRVVMKFTKRLK